MTQTVNWTVGLQIADQPLFTAADTLQVQAVGRVNVDLPVGVEDQAVHLLVGADEEISLLMLSANLYVDPLDRSKILRMKGATDDHLFDLSAPFFLADTKLLKVLLGENGILFFSNPLPVSVALDILFCRNTTLHVTPLSESTDAATEAMSFSGLPGHDDLTQINGIGPVYHQRLQDAGIHTLAALAAASPDQIKATIGAKPWHAVDVASWIEQAQMLTAAAKPDPSNDGGAFS